MHGTKDLQIPMVHSLWGLLFPLYPVAAQPHFTKRVKRSYVRGKF